MSNLSTSTSSPVKRLPLIDELKGYGICLVIYYHIGGVMRWPNWFHGEVGVDVFLLVSGFTLAKSATDLPWQTYLVRRFSRIFPAYWIALVFFYFTRTRLLAEHYTVSSLVLHALGLHGFAPGRYFNEYNDSFWFISLIIALYTVFLCIRKYMRNVTAIMGIGMLLTTIAAYSYLAADHGGGVITLVGRIPGFFLGLVAGRLDSGRDVSWKLSPLFAAGALSLMILGWTKGIIPFYLVAGVAMTSGFIVLAQLARKWAPSRYLLKIFAFLGVYSYEIYLFHQPLIRDFTGAIGSRFYQGEFGPSEWAKGIWIGLTITFILAIVVHHSIRKVVKMISRPPAAG